MSGVCRNNKQILKEKLEQNFKEFAIAVKKFDFSLEPKLVDEI
jgi:hypothetical protein